MSSAAEPAPSGPATTRAVPPSAAARAVPLALRQRLAVIGRQTIDLLLRNQWSSAARERRDMLVLLAAVGLIAAPHAMHLPWWAPAVFWALWGWRLWLTLARRPLPGRLALMPMVVAVAGAAWVTHHDVIARDTGITFLLMLTGLKLLEMRSRRDVYVTVVLALFLLLTQFMFDQSIPMAALAVVAVLALFFVLISVQAVESDVAAARRMRVLLLIAVQALPLAIAMFVFFPRLDGPLWGTPQPLGRGETGLSDTMSPGSLSELLESERIAFRARFDGAPPARAALYWRGPVLARYDGRTWRPRPERISDRRPPRSRLDVDPATAIDYEVTIEPHQRTWLFAIDVAPGPVSGDALASYLDNDFELHAQRPIVSRTRYRVRSYLGFRAGADAGYADLADWLELPRGFNSRTLAFARALDARLVARGTDAGHDGDAARVAAVLDYLRHGGFHYTLEPPELGRDAVDEFLFETHLGFCEHYASAFVVLMRALGIPARVVTGYQGGEINPTDGYLTVRQSDAHAWAEVWMAGRGWQRVDPTAVVAPIRLERGAPQAELEQPSVFGTFEAKPLEWLHAARLRWEAAENGWNQWVLSYSPGRQRQLLAALGFAPSWRTLALIFSVLMVAMLAVVAALTFRTRERLDPLARLQQTLRRRLAVAGVAVPAHAGLRAIAAAASSGLRQGDAQAARRIVAHLETARYAAPAATSLDARRRLAREVARFRPKRPRR